MNTYKKSIINSGEYGFSHFFLPVVVAMLVIGVGFIVYDAGHHTVKSVNSVQNKKSETAAKKQTSPKTSTATTLTTVPTTSTTSSGTTSNKTSSSTKITTSTSKSSTPSSSSSSSSSPASSSSSSTQTPLEALTTLCSQLDAGDQANVTVQSITIPGPITNATGRPLVFSVNGQTYFAYTQESKPNFNQSASQTANSMAIVNASGSYTLTEAHLDKTGILVDENEVAVGYSTGGD